MLLGEVTSGPRSESPIIDVELLSDEDIHGNNNVGMFFFFINFDFCHLPFILLCLKVLAIKCVKETCLV